MQYILIVAGIVVFLTFIFFIVVSPWLKKRGVKKIEYNFVKGGFSLEMQNDELDTNGPLLTLCRGRIISTSKEFIVEIYNESQKIAQLQRVIINGEECDFRPRNVNPRHGDCKLFVDEDIHKLAKNGKNEIKIIYKGVTDKSFYSVARFNYIEESQTGDLMQRDTQYGSWEE